MVATKEENVISSVSSFMESDEMTRWAREIIDQAKKSKEPRMSPRVSRALRLLLTGAEVLWVGLLILAAWELFYDSGQNYLIPVPWNHSYRNLQWAVAQLFTIGVVLCLLWLDRKLRQARAWIRGD